MEVEFSWVTFRVSINGLVKTDLLGRPYSASVVSPVSKQKYVRVMSRSAGNHDQYIVEALGYEYK